MRIGSDEFRGWLRRVGISDPADCTDTVLLARYVRENDDDAFEALVRRHAGLVLGIANRTLANRHDAEDVFQATFFELVRRASALIRHESLGGWLYQTAYHAALNLRRTRKRQLARELCVARPEQAGVGPDSTDAADDAVDALIQEVARLPARYREAVILCDVEGKSREDAARCVGVPVGTLSGRLTSARRMLRIRLERRGVAVVSATLLSTIITSEASALSPGLLRATAAIAAGEAPVRIARLITGGSIMVSLTKYAMVAGAAIALAWFIGTGSEPAAVASAPPPKAPAKSEPEGPADFLKSRTWSITAVDAEKGTLNVTEQFVPPPAKMVPGLQLGGKIQIQIAPGAVQILPAGVNPPPPTLDPVTLDGLKLANGATVTLDSKAVKIADLKPGVVATLELQADGSVSRVTAMTIPTPDGYFLKAVDLKTRRVTIAVDGKERELTLAKDVKVVSRVYQMGPAGTLPMDEEGKLEDLKKKVGGAVSVQCGVEGGKIVVTTIQTN